MLTNKLQRSTEWVSERNEPGKVHQHQKIHLDFMSDIQFIVSKCHCKYSEADRYVNSFRAEARLATWRTRHAFGFGRRRACSGKRRRLAHRQLVDILEYDFYKSMYNFYFSKTGNESTKYDRFEDIMCGFLVCFFFLIFVKQRGKWSGQSENRSLVCKKYCTVLGDCWSSFPLSVTSRIRKHGRLLCEVIKPQTLLIGLL